jgi:hypothetical protein
MAGSGGGAEIWQWLFPTLIEMFEHMMNWRELMTCVRLWLVPHGRFFVHIFTGDVMPSHHLIRHCADIFAVEKEWRWSGTYYARTANDRLDNFHRHRDEIERILRSMDATPHCGCGAGAGSFSRPQACLARWMEANGA